MSAEKNIAKIEKFAQKKKSDKIMGFLKSKDKDVRLAAIRALGDCGDDDSFNNLVSLLNSADSEERLAVVEGLGKTGRETAFTFLSHNVNDESDEKVADAMRKALSDIKANMGRG